MLDMDIINAIVGYRFSRQTSRNIHHHQNIIERIIVWIMQNVGALNLYAPPV